MSYLDKVYEVGISDEWRWERIRIHRDALLLACDWRMVADATWDKNAWVIYRQTLRDLPLSVADPSKIVFPNEPA